MQNPRRVLITGGSSGIGEALAMIYAKRRCFVAISGRDEARVKAVGEKIEAAGGTADARVIDVCDDVGMAAWINEVDDAGPLDLVIANAGVGFGSTVDMTLHERAVKTFEINVGGVFNTVHPAIERMKKRGRGQIATVSSLAGIVGLPDNPAYSGSKNAVRAYTESLRGTYAHRGIEISAICPGYVKSRLTDQNKFNMPFFMDTPKAAEIIVKGLEKNKGRIAFPFPMFALVRFAQIIPYFLAEKLLAAMAPKRNYEANTKS